MQSDPNHPNAAIGYDQRAIVGRALSLFLAGTDTSGVNRQTLSVLADRLASPGPSLVSTADVDELLDLISSLHLANPSDRLNHAWGYVEVDAAGFHVQLWNTYGAPTYKRFSRYEAVKLARAMYEHHLRRRGLIPTSQTVPS